VRACVMDGVNVGAFSGATCTGDNLLPADLGGRCSFGRICRGGFGIFVLKPRMVLAKDISDRVSVIG
jgi:hypothetical protein